MDDLQIHDLRDRPDLLDVVAENIWRVFWAHKGSRLDDLRDGFRRHLQPGDLPVTLAAERGGVFVGTVSLIVCDEPERSDLAPWLAALWVEESARKAGIGAALIDAVVQRCRGIGVARLYLSARPQVAPYYEKRGWQVIDREIGPARLAILDRAISP